MALWLMALWLMALWLVALWLMALWLMALWLMAKPGQIWQPKSERPLAKPGSQNRPSVVAFQSSRGRYFAGQVATQKSGHIGSIS